MNIAQPGIWNQLFKKEFGIRIRAQSGTRANDARAVRVVGFGLFVEEVYITLRIIRVRLHHLPNYEKIYITP